MIEETAENECDKKTENSSTRRFELTVNTSGALDARQFIHFSEVMDMTLTCQRLLHPNSLSELGQLRRLDIYKSRIKESGLVFSNGFSSLEELLLRKTDVTNSMLTGIHALPNLRCLDLGITEISVKGIDAIAGHQRLEDVLISKTAVSDASIESLKSIVNLRRLDVAGSQISDAGIKMLREGLPGLETLMRMGNMIGDDGQSMGPCYFNAIDFDSENGVLNRSNVAETLIRE